MSVLVTGATGFLGRRLVRLLREDGVDVRCLVRPSSDVEPLRRTVGDDLWSGVDVHTAELMDGDTCREVMTGCSVVYHVAAGLSGSTSTLFLKLSHSDTTSDASGSRCQCAKVRPCEFTGSLWYQHDAIRESTR